MELTIVSRKICILYYNFRWRLRHYVI